MAWTAPLTAVDGTYFTSSQYNAFIRDDLLAQAPEQASGAGYYFVSGGQNSVLARKPKQAIVTTSETTTKTSYSNLGTIGPQVVLEHGKTVLVFISCNMQNTNADNTSAVSVEAFGGVSISPDDRWRLKMDGVPANQASRYSMVRLIGDIKDAPATSTFRLKYRVGGGTGTFSDRTICVFPLS
jgi:hypothetical protein